MGISGSATEKNNVVWLEPAPFENTCRIAVPEEFAQENDVTNMTQAAGFIRNNPDQGAVCAASEFINRDDGLPGLEKFYNFDFSEVVELDLSLIYTQVGQECNFGEVFSTAAILEPDTDPVPRRSAVNLDSVESLSTAVLIARLGRLVDGRMDAVRRAQRSG